jgi:hypothetical protein
MKEGGGRPQDVSTPPPPPPSSLGAAASTRRVAPSPLAATAALVGPHLLAHGRAALPRRTHSPNTPTFLDPELPAATAALVGSRQHPLARGRAALPRRTRSPTAPTLLLVKCIAGER